MESNGKYIYCLEGNWNKHPRSKQSIRPILDILYTTSNVKYIYHKCQTKEEFFYHLERFTSKRYKNYPILYIAFHGLTNRICIGNETVTLREIAKALEGKLAGKIVHFGSCSTLRTSESNISNFISRTQCKFISGYKKKVDYIVSTAFEMIYFDMIQNAYSATRLWSELLSSYSYLLSSKIKFIMSD